MTLLLLAVGCWLLAEPQPSEDKLRVGDEKQPKMMTLSQGEKVYMVEKPEPGKPAVAKLEIDGMLSAPTMPLEFFACAEGGRDYESMVLLKCHPQNIHLSLILMGLKEGKGPEFFGDTKKPTGDLVLVFVSWEKDGKTVTYRAEDLITDAQTKKPMPRTGWSFSGSRFEPEMDYDTGQPTGRKTYLANVTRTIMATWHDQTAVLNIPTRGGLYYPNKEILPKEGVEVKVTFRAPDEDELKELKKINEEAAKEEATPENPDKDKK
ncbi:hypothetical protein HY772_03855 [Candidatus Woesearchaeota archaeon]|nr:hypothetical protein [Candidatus Woesearchaeota archaeon]